MSTQINQYTDARYVGYIYRNAAYRIEMTRCLETAMRRNETGIVKICIADHASLGPTGYIEFSSRDQSWGALDQALKCDDGEDPGMDTVIEYTA